MFEKYDVDFNFKRDCILKYFCLFRCLFFVIFTLEKCYRQS